jgi:hypothetical protein
MAYIQRIQIEDYRSIKRMDIDLSPADARPFRHLILTGPNGSGKSSALERIHSELPKRTPPKNQRLVVFFQAQRLLKIQEVAGPAKIDWPTVAQKDGYAAALASQLLVNRKVEQSFARDDGDLATVIAIDAWFAELRNHLAHILEDPGLKLQFDRKNFDVRLRYSDDREVTFNQLAQGHSAALSIFFELLIRTQAQREVFDVPREQLEGIVFIDEIETHLHLRLQELILPFLTDLFPSFQFLVATHSPAVIASIPDAVVYDLGKREAVASEDLQGIRYGTLMTHHFGIAADMDLDSTEKLARLRQLARLSRSPEEEAEFTGLADTLTDRSPTLALEVWKIQNPAPVPRGPA